MTLKVEKNDDGTVALTMVLNRAALSAEEQDDFLLKIAEIAGIDPESDDFKRMKDSATFVPVVK